MMAGNARHATIAWDDIPVIDRVSRAYGPLKDLTPARLSRCHSLAYGSGFGGDVGANALLLHEEGEKTYLRGSCVQLGLSGQCQERDIQELRDQKVVQVAFSFGAGYILVEDGTVYPSGSRGQLGRPDKPVPANLFGAVPIPQAVKQIAAGAAHVLAMAEDRVFVFGDNNNRQLGIPKCLSVHDPKQIYGGTGLAAPRQVASGGCHSVILTVGGQVFTFGEHGYTGQGHSKEVPEMSEVRGLRGHHVQQVGSTGDCTYALSGGILYGWGHNNGGQLGLGYASGLILEPTIIRCEERQITSFRCENRLVLALTATGDVLYWGVRRHGVIVQFPQLVSGRQHPREVFAEGRGSGGLVFLDTNENRQRVFPALHALEPQDDAVDVRNLQEATADASVTVQNRLQKAEADIAELKRLMEESIKREHAASQALARVENDRSTFAEEIGKLQQRCSGLQATIYYAAAQALQREKDAERGRVSQAEEISELRRQIFGHQTTLDASAEQYLERENVWTGTIRLIEQGRFEQAEELRNLRQRVAGMQLAPDAATGLAMPQQNAQQPGHGDCAARIAELERENLELKQATRELRLEKREQSAQFRSATVDYRELLLEYNAHSARIAELERETLELRLENSELRLEYNAHIESCGTTPMRGAGSVEQDRRGRYGRRGATHPSSGRQRRN